MSEVLTQVDPDDSLEELSGKRLIAAAQKMWDDSEAAKKRARLEREVIEVAKRWSPKRGEHGTHHTSRQCPACAAERMFHKAGDDLVRFEAQQK